MRKFVALIVLVLLVVGAWSGGWVWAAGEVRRGVVALGEGDGSARPKVTCGTLDITGFPFRLDVACMAATIVDGDVTTTVAGIKGSMLVYNPTQVLVSALSPATVEDAYSGARSRIAFTGAEGSARLVTDDVLKGLTGEGWRVGRVSFVADGITVTDTLVGETLALSAAHAEAHLIDVPERHDPAAGTSVLAAYVELSGADAPGIEVAGGAASIEAELSGLPDDVRLLGEADVLCRVRDAGGELKLVSAKGNSGEEFFESTGAIRLDAAGKPDGQLRVTSRGIVERVEPMVPPELKFVFGQQAADGSYAQTLNFKAGIVLAGLLPMPFLLAPLCAG
jgi:hypothetical protein